MIKNLFNHRKHFLFDALNHASDKYSYDMIIIFQIVLHIPSWSESPFKGSLSAIHKYVVKPVLSRPDY